VNVRRVPGVGYVLSAGADDRVFDTLLLLGPPVVVLIALLHRSTVTEVIAGGYIAAFVLYTLYRGVS